VIDDILASKTAKLWLLLIAVGFGMVVFATAMAVAGVSVPFVTEFFSLLGVGGGATTTRNVMVDGPIRRESAATDPAATGYGPPPQ
jgi:hypothetical protein